MFEAAPGASPLIQAQAARVRAEFPEFYAYLAEHDVRLGETVVSEQRPLQLALRDEFAPPAQLVLAGLATRDEARS
jgi:hypothetical protein